MKNVSSRKASHFRVTEQTSELTLICMYDLVVLYGAVSTAVVDTAPKETLKQQ
jgi:hypothetical protein